MLKYYELHLTRTGKQVGSKDGYELFSEDRQIFPNTAAVKTYLREQYGHCKREKMYMDKKDGEVWDYDRESDEEEYCPSCASLLTIKEKKKIKPKNVEAGGRPYMGMRRCDNVDCYHNHEMPLYRCKIKPEFEGGTCGWCAECIARDGEMLKK